MSSRSFNDDGSKGLSLVRSFEDIRPKAVGMTKEAREGHLFAHGITVGDPSLQD
jgi:hypothetical protein